MSTEENIPTGTVEGATNAFSPRIQAQVDELLTQMQRTQNPEEMLALAERLKALSVQPVDELHTFAEDELPEWAIHEEDQEGLDAFFNFEDDRGDANSQFTIPRGVSEGSEVAVRGSTQYVAQAAEPEEPAEPTQPVEAAEAHKHEDAPPRREDFAKFRCLYESQDGQLALYEDEHGHLTAVNTNRFV